MGYNKHISEGRVARDPELRYTKDKQTPVCEFSVALDSGWGDHKRTTFIDCTAWGKQAEFVKKYFKKGDGIFIDGRLDQDIWEDKETGKRRSKHKITVQVVSFPVGSKKKSDSEEVDQSSWQNKKIDEIPF